MSRKNISKSNTYGLVYSDISESINQMQNDLQKIILNKEKADMKINIVRLLNNDDKELTKLSKLGKLSKQAVRCVNGNKLP